MLHEALTHYFETLFLCDHPSLNFDAVANCGLAHFIMRELLWPEHDKKSYAGHLLRIAVAIHRIYEMKGNLFFSLYQCTDEMCLNSGLQHPITRGDWLTFVKTFVVGHLDLCYFEAEGEGSYVE